MKNTVKILAAAFAMTCVFAACDSRLEQPLTQANIVLAPEVYGTFDAPETRAHDLGDRYNDFNDPAIRNRLTLVRMKRVLYTITELSKYSVRNVSRILCTKIHSHSFGTYKLNHLLNLFKQMLRCILKQ